MKNTVLSKVMSNHNRERIVPIGLLWGCVGLLQWHSIAFWSRHVDPATGWTWSLLLEAVGLWLWYRTGWPLQCLAAAASVLLLVGPLYVVAEPVADELLKARESREIARKMAAAKLEAAEKKSAAVTAAKAETERARDRAIPVLEREIRALEDQLKVFLNNSTERSGWLPAIEKTQSELAERRKEMTDLYLAGAKTEPPEVGEAQAMPTQPVPGNPATELGAIAIIAMQCLALILYQVTGVLAIRRLSQLAASKADVEMESNGTSGGESEPLPTIDTKVLPKRPRLVLYG